MRVLLDTDVVLDVVLAREPFGRIARQRFKLHDEEIFEACIAAITPVHVFYFARKFKGAYVAREALRVMLTSFTVCPLTNDILRAAYRLSVSDYEDAVQNASATAVGVHAIVTRDVGDYRRAMLPVFTPEGFLQHLKSNQQEQT